MARTRVHLVGLAVLCGLAGCLHAKPVSPEEKVCNTVTPGVFGAPVPTSCHPRYTVPGDAGAAVAPRRPHPQADGK